MPAAIDLVGQRFGLLTVLAATRKHYSDRRGMIRAWECACDCGGSLVVFTGSLRSGGTRSCGCRKRAVLGESTTRHGMAHTRTYRIYRAMLTRCYNPNTASYRNHGARGIKVCERWRSFENFLTDMGEAPAGHSIDRWPDNDGNYEPGNCRWATPKEQGRNTRVNRMIEHKGEVLCLAVWAERLGVTSDVLWKRLKRHGSIEI